MILFALGIISFVKVLYFMIPCLCVFLSTLFFFGYIVWFDNGFKSDEEYTLEELKELEIAYLTKGGNDMPQTFSPKEAEEPKVNSPGIAKD